MPEMHAGFEQGLHLNWTCHKVLPYVFVFRAPHPGGDPTAHHLVRQSP